MGYFFDFSPATNHFYLVANKDFQDDSDTGKLALISFDNHLHLLSSVNLLPKTGEFLRALNRANLASNFTYIHSMIATDSSLVVNLIHPADTTLVLSIQLQPADSLFPDGKYLGYLAFPELRRKSMDEETFANFKLTDRGIYFVRQNTLYGTSKPASSETPLLKFRADPRVDSHPPQKYIVSEKLNLLLAIDGSNHLSILQKQHEKWESLASFEVDTRADDISLDEDNRLLLFYSRGECRHIPLDELIEQAKGKSYVDLIFTPGYHDFYDPNGQNYHFGIDNGSLTLIDNNHAEVSKPLYPGNFTKLKYSRKENILTAVTQEDPHPTVLVTDLSNLSLPERIPDDSDFSSRNFKAISPFSADDSTKLKQGDRILKGNKDGFTIQVNDQVSYRYTPDHAGSISYMQFLQDPDLVLFLTTDDMLGKLIANVYNINTGFRATYNISSLMRLPSEFQVTKKYIYFSEEDPLDPFKSKKRIRLVNPAIPYKEFNQLLDKSIY
jgi:hypothetical protein